MDPLRNFADDRLLNGCVYRGAGEAETRDHVPSRAFLARPYPENLPVDGQVGFGPEASRLARVARKLAAGHAAFELAFAARHEPTSLWTTRDVGSSGASRVRRAATRLNPGRSRLACDAADAGHRADVQAKDGGSRALRFLLNDWIDVQEGSSRYFAAETLQRVVIRLVIAAYLAAEAWWGSEGSAWPLRTRRKIRTRPRRWPTRRTRGAMPTPSRPDRKGSPISLEGITAAGGSYPLGCPLRTAPRRNTAILASSTCCPLLRRGTFWPEKQKPRNSFEVARLT